MDLVIGIGEYGIIDRSGDRLMTHALASCVAVTFFSEKPKVAAMIHIALPDPQDAQTPVSKPAYYAATGLPMLIRALKHGYGLRPESMRIHVIGGAQSVNGNDRFKIGERNLEKVREILSDFGVPFNQDEVRGTVSRTVVMDLDAGAMTIHYQKIVV